MSELRAALDGRQSATDDQRIAAVLRAINDADGLSNQFDVGLSKR